MSFGLALWLFVTVFLLGFWGWTTYILFQQKSGWKAFALKNKLRYRSSGFLESAEVSGSFNGYQVTIFATDHGTGTNKTRRMMTTVEVSLKGGLPVPCAIASGEMVRVVQELGLTQEYRPDINGWDISYIARSRDNDALEVYLNEKRVKTYANLMKNKGAWVIVIFGGDIGLLRLDTPYPLTNMSELSKLLNDMTSAALVFEPVEDELKEINIRKAKNTSKSNIVRVDENINKDVGISLSLEEE